jgi:hypothetical protein
MQAIFYGATCFKTGGAFTCTLTLTNGICIHGNCECSVVPANILQRSKSRHLENFLGTRVVDLLAKSIQV